MTGPIEGLGPDSFMLSGAEAAPPKPANDNVRHDDQQTGFFGLLLRRAEEKFEIVLIHNHPSLSQRVETADDDADIIALWRGIGRKLNLPLFAESGDGSMIRIEPIPCMTAHMRRHGSPLNYRRPRFLARRQVGRPVAAKKSQNA